MENHLKKSDTTSKKSKRSRVPFYLGLSLLLGLVGCYFLIPSFREFSHEAFVVLSSGDRERTSEWVKQFGVWGPLVIILAQTVQMFLFVVPTVLIMIVSILAYGPWVGSVYAMIGIVTASTLAYLIGRTTSEAFLNKMLGRKTKKRFIEYVDLYGGWLVAVARINPVLSNDTVSLVSGLVRLNFWKFITATMIATVPLLMLISYLGENQQRLKSGMLWISIGGLLLAGGYILFKEIQKKKLNRGNAGQTKI